MNLLSRCVWISTFAAATVSLAGCTATLPTVSSHGRPGRLDPYEEVDKGTEVTLVFKDQRVLKGVYDGFSDEQDTSYEDRFEDGVRGDSTLRGAPMLGDTVRATVGLTHPMPLDGSFAGMGSSLQPGVYLDIEGSGTRFYTASSVVSLEHADGRPINLGSLHHAVVTGRIPSRRERVIRQISLYVWAEGGPQLIDARQLDHIEVAREQDSSGFVLVGVLVGAALIYAGMRFSKCGIFGCD